MSEVKVTLEAVANRSPEGVVATYVHVKSGDVELWFTPDQAEAFARRMLHHAAEASQEAKRLADPAVADQAFAAAGLQFVEVAGRG